MKLFNADNSKSPHFYVSPSEESKERFGTTNAELRERIIARNKRKELIDLRQEVVPFKSQR